jgi:hypothetical protein
MPAALLGIEPDGFQQRPGDGGHRQLPRVRRDADADVESRIRRHPPRRLVIGSSAEITHAPGCAAANAHRKPESRTHAAERAGGTRPPGAFPVARLAPNPHASERRPPAEACPEVTLHRASRACLSRVPAIFSPEKSP